MSTPPLLSIGLFLYNGEKFLAGAIESILDQTFKNFELIISDNCSTDRSGEICRHYAARDERIRYYRNDRNMGAGWNLRRVYELATGKYFKQAAHDDMIQQDYLRLCVDALEADDSLVLAHSLTRVIDQAGQFVENYNDGSRTSSFDPVVRARDLLLRSRGAYPIFGVIRMDALQQLPPQGSYTHSARVLLLQLGLLGRFYEVPEYLFISSRHSGQSQWTFPERSHSKAFRLTRRCGTLPPAEWWDPAKARDLVFPEWNVVKEFAVSIARAPLTPWQKTQCYSLVARWMRRYYRRMGKDVLVAADQLLFNFQYRHIAYGQVQSMDSSHNIVSFEGESL
jgi:glycosyltransferase involved in cell wall biosynthesis